MKTHLWCVDKLHLPSGETSAACILHTVNHRQMLNSHILTVLPRQKHKYEAARAVSLEQWSNWGRKGSRALQSARGAAYTGASDPAAEPCAWDIGSTGLSLSLQSQWLPQPVLVSTMEVTSWHVPGQTGGLWQQENFSSFNLPRCQTARGERVRLGHDVWARVR